MFGHILRPLWHFGFWGFLNPQIRKSPKFYQNCLISKFLVFFLVNLLWNGFSLQFIEITSSRNLFRILGKYGHLREIPHFRKISTFCVSIILDIYLSITHLEVINDFKPLFGKEFRIVYIILTPEMCRSV